MNVLKRPVRWGIDAFAPSDVERYTVSGENVAFNTRAQPCARENPYRYSFAYVRTSEWEEVFGERWPGRTLPFDHSRDDNSADASAFPAGLSDAIRKKRYLLTR